MPAIQLAFILAAFPVAGQTGIIQPAVPLIVGYAYHKGAWKARAGRRWNRLLEPAAVV